MTKSLNCPNCAAPLQVRELQTVALCVYCGSSIKLDAAGVAPQPIEQRELTPEVLSQVNQLLLDGRRAEAVTLYQQQAGVTGAEAREAIDNLATQLTRRTLVIPADHKPGPLPVCRVHGHRSWRAGLGPDQ